MKCMDINKQTLYYALFNGSEEITETDEQGNIIHTGQYKVVYCKPVKMRANISPAQGTSQIEIFGNSLNYNKVIVTDDLECPIDEFSVLVLGEEPRYDSNDNLLFNYIVKKVARSLNVVSIAVSKVDVGTALK